MKLVIIGGHLSPALAVIDALPKDTEVLFIGRKYALEGDNAFSLEYKTIAKGNIPFSEISTGRLQRIFTKHTIPSLLKIPYGFIQSFFILYKFKPDVCLGFGGYLSVPVGIVAFFLRIPLIIHEQTLEAGIANRILSIFAKKVCVSWETSRKFFPRDKTILTGNPIRKFENVFEKFRSNLRHAGNSERSVEAPRISMEQRDAGQASMTGLPNMNKELPILYVTGGSSGSHFINTLVESCIRQLLEKFIVIHQTGDAQKYHDFDRLQKIRGSFPSELKTRYTLIKFVEPENIGLIMQRADLVVSRAGINTVTELIFFKKPSLLIPLPASQRNDQLKNALYIKSLSLSEIFYQSAQDSKKFLKMIIDMFDNIDKYKAKYKLETKINTNAAQKILEVIEYAKKANKEQVR